MKTLILKLLPLLFAIVGTGALKSQPIATTAGAVTSCPGEIAVPVNVTNCNGIGAISLILNFDNTKLTYLGYQNLNSALSTGLLIINSTGSKVVISWANTTAANLGASTMVQLRFNAISGTSNLTWDNQTTGNCEYSDINGNILAATFTDGTATINQPPGINIQPADMTSLVGQNTSFSLSATGTDIVYAWQLSTNGGSTWADLVNNVTYSGVTTSTLGITNTQLSYNAYKYRCRLTGTCTPVVYTDVVTLTVINPVTTTLPTASSCPGSIVIPVTVTNFTGIAAFSLTFAYNTSCLTYTGFQTLNGALSGGTFVSNAIGGKVFMTWTSTTAATFADGTLVQLLFTSVTGTSSLAWDMASEGNCEYSTLSGTLTTSVFVNGSETIYALPAVTGNPTDKTIAKGQNTTFNVTATGSGIGYLWQVSTNGGSIWADLANNSTYSNVGTSALTISNAQLSLNGYLFRCKVSGTCTPIVYSNPALLTVLPNVITNCATATGCPGQIIVPVTVTDFIGVASFSLSLNYNSTILAYSGYQNLNASVSGGIFSINAASNKVFITWSNTSAATISTGAPLLELKFNGTPGVSALTWDTQTSGNCEYSDLSGQVIFSTWNNGNATVNLPPAIGTQPENQVVYAGGSTSFSVAATGTGLGFLWQVSTNGGSNWTNLTNVSPYSGVSTSNLTISPATTGLNNNLYHCIVTGTCTPSATSGPGQLTVTQAAITTTSGTITGSCTGNLIIPLNVTNCTNIGGISLAMIFDTTKLTFEGYQSANAELSSGLLVVNRTGNRVFMSWASTTVANIGSGVLIQYRFKANASTSTTLSWDASTAGACEYSDPAGTIITSFYTGSSLSVATNALIVNAGTDLSMAPGGNVQLSGSVTGGATPYVYLWTPSTGLSNPAISNPVATPAATTTYTLTVTGNGVCTGTDNMTVTVTSGAHTLNLQLLLEGLYNGGSSMRQAFDEFGGPHFTSPTADQITVELHAAANYASIAYTASAVNISTSGAATISVPAEISGSYYITVAHRNSVKTTTASPVSFSGATINYSFDAPAKAYGNNLKLLATSVYGIFAGNVNTDAAIDTADLNSILTSASEFASGYLTADVNGDGVVDALDMVMTDNNAANFVVVKTPP
jgi:hypothetical protein